MFDALVRPAKNLLRGPYRRLQKKYFLRFHGFDSADLLRTLRQLDVNAGDAVIVHSGMTEFAGFRGRVVDIVRTFQEAVGPRGSLLMPTIPFTGSALDYVASGSIFDPRTTPSKVGLLSEIFRRFPGVVRSIHPTHSVAVWGARQDWFIENHIMADTPCGRGTPFDRLCEADGKIVLAGVTIAAMSYFHCVEEILEPRMPFSPFTRERYTMACRLNGRILESAPMRLFDRTVSKRRNLEVLITELQKNGHWKEGQVGTLHLIVLRARDVLQTLEEMADRGIFCYRP